MTNTITVGDILLSVAMARQQLDTPTPKSIYVAQEILDALEWRLTTDCIELGLSTEPEILTSL